MVLLYVTESNGSSPGRKGFCMAVSPYAMQGSIGGGIMEQKLVELARDLLKKGKHEAILKHQIHRKDASKDQSGMICSGDQTIAMVPLYPSCLPVVGRLLACLQNSSSGVLRLSPEGIDFEEETPANDDYFVVGDNWAYQEQIGFKNRLFVIGGGHVGLAFSKVMANLDFHIHVFDDREGLNTLENNHYAHRTTVVSYEQLGNLIPEGAHNYVVIMTFGYRSDDVAVRQLLDKKLKYLGLMGSQAKIDQLLAGLRHSGVSEEHISRICTPIGLPIDSKTPAEIAISIAAEIIGVKNKAKKGNS